MCPKLHIMFYVARMKLQLAFFISRFYLVKVRK